MCNGSQELSWNARSAVDLSPARGCTVTGGPDQCLRGEKCLDATLGSAAPCSTDSESCICKLPPVGGILDGARRTYANDAARAQNVEDLGDTTGVSQDLSP